MEHEVPAQWLASSIRDRSAQGIASEVAQLINSGELRPGTRLPSVRDLAAHLRVSPATVSSAWGTLKQFGSVEGRGRAGTTVLGPQTPHPRRYGSEGAFDVTARLELGLSVPDPALLPDVAAYLRPRDVPDLHEYRRIAIHEPLERAAREHWPYPGEAFAALSSGYEGLLMSLRTFVRPGDNVVVEEPSPPRILDSLEHVGCRPVFVGRDDEGIRLDDLEQALARKPTVLVLQPGIHNPDGSAMSAQRADDIADMLRDSDLITVEDDGIGFLSTEPPESLAQRRRDRRHVFVRSFSKSHGPDLRLAIIEGGELEVEQISSYWEFGARWASRLLQDALARMLEDPAAWHTVEAARSEYHQRREAFLDRYALREAVSGRGLLDVWLQVPNERRAVVTLAAHGVPSLGAHLFYASRPPDRIRMSTSRLTEEAWPVLDRVMPAVSMPHLRQPGRLATHQP
ncbi:PLP-dependent aminotransferase family protein [Ornithinimicrobium pekingense]|nr:PLP-dependent aminotransferase family protein [Ornithinimicrobium pekingense]